jgi:sodium-dependent dicarboxylate transporter 2/3/5
MVIPSAALRAAVVAAILFLVIEFGLADIAPQARRALQIFALAIVCWTMTPLDDVFVALFAAVLMALFVVGSPDELFAALGDNLVWLLVASFVFAAAFKASGLADTILRKVAALAGSVRGLFHALASVMLASAFMIPSTSGRAALMIPIFATIAPTLGSGRMRVAFALLFPTVILLSAIGSLVGAGAHIAAVELLNQMRGRTISFAEWTFYCLPLALVSVFAAVETILRLFMTADEARMRIAPIADDKAQVPVLTQPVLWIAVAVLAGWLTKPLHGLDETLVAIIGALAITAPGIGPVKFRDALKEVEWGLLVFLATTVFLAKALVSSKLASQLLDGPLEVLTRANISPALFVVVVAVAGALLHLIVHSRTARVAVLVPPLLLLGPRLGLDPVAITLVAVAATGYCQTLMVSAKPVILFGKIEGETYRQADLLRLGAILLPLQIVLVTIFAVFIWPMLGLRLTG